MFNFISLQRQAKQLKEERNSIIIEEEESLKNYYSLIEQYKSLKEDVREIVFSPKYCLPFLQPGRLVCIECSKTDEDLPSFSIEDNVSWGVIINFQKTKRVSEGVRFLLFAFFRFFLYFISSLFSYVVNYSST